MDIAVNTTVVGSLRIWRCGLGITQEQHLRTVDGMWHHIAIVHERSYCTLYVDGMQISKHAVGWRYRWLRLRRTLTHLRLNAVRALRRLSECDCAVCQVKRNPPTLDELRRDSEPVDNIEDAVR
jgi:hypothetical protein